MLGWLRSRGVASAARKALVETDAAALIVRFGEQAYFVARDRNRDERKGVIVDAGRPARHWSAIRLRISDITGKPVGMDATTRYLRHR